MLQIFATTSLLRLFTSNRLTKSFGPSSFISIKKKSLAHLLAPFFFFSLVFFYPFLNQLLFSCARGSKNGLNAWYIIENRSLYQSSWSLGWVVIDIFIGGGSHFVTLDKA